LVPCPKRYAFSSLHRFVERGVYPENWGCDQMHVDFGSVEAFVGEVD
jgi:hypothetical protein